MTVIVGLAYHDGLVFGSDLLTFSPNDYRRACRKLYHNNIAVVGAIGDATEKVFNLIGSRIPRLFMRHSHRYLEEKGLDRFVRNIGRQGYLDVGFVIGYNNGQEFRLLRKSSHGNFRAACSTLLIARPGIALPDIFERHNIDVHSQENAVEIVTGVLKGFTKFPEEYSGLEVLHMDKSGVTQVAYEPPKL